MPVFCHEREAHQSFVEIMKRHRSRDCPLVVHCFTGTRQEVENYLQLDCHIGKAYIRMCICILFVCSPLWGFSRIHRDYLQSKTRRRIARDFEKQDHSTGTNHDRNRCSLHDSTQHALHCSAKCTLFVAVFVFDSVFFLLLSLGNLTCDSMMKGTLVPAVGTENVGRMLW